MSAVCAHPGCAGAVVDGACEACGAVSAGRDGQVAVDATTPTPAPVTGVQTAASGTVTLRRGTTTRSASTTYRSRLGAGLVDVPPIPARDPSDEVLVEPNVDERRRFCARCDAPVGRARGGLPGRTEGFCPSCGAPFSFRPKLAPGGLVAGQYEVVGCLAHGGMGWVYLARDRNVSDRWVVLKGLLNTGDDAATAAALAERRFLAEVEHPNIVKILNFVQHEGSGYIVMEYVGGTSVKQLLRQRREANGGVPDPLPVAQAIAYVLEILPALGHLHRSGLLFCDFKVDNVMQTQHSLKLIDLGAVHRADDRWSPVYGTVGYQAPEIGETGPTIPSDLFTVARALCVMCVDFTGYQNAFRFTLPSPDDVPLFRRYHSLYRFLLRGTAWSPDSRFQSAEEMSEQLVGVLREVVADVDGTPVPALSTLFTGELRARPSTPDWRALPVLLVGGDDPAAGYVAALAATEPAELVELLRSAPARTVEVDLRLARALIDLGDVPGAEAVAAAVEAEDPWEWRAAWYRGVAALADDRPDDARASFATVYETVPGELAPKLALGLAAECAGEIAEAASWYEIVSRTDPSHASATFGLARTRQALGDRAAALAALERVPASAGSYTEARVALIRCLIGRDGGVGPGTADLRRAAAVFEEVPLDAEQRARVAAELLEAALDLVLRGAAPPDPEDRFVGHPFDERGLRLGLEERYRELARWTADRADRTRLVDRANGVRPRTWR